MGVDTGPEILQKTRHVAVLIDIEELATLMIDYGIGVAVDATYEIKRLDRDYFEEEL